MAESASLPVLVQKGGAATNLTDACFEDGRADGALPAFPESASAAPFSGVWQPHTPLATTLFTAGLAEGGVGSYPDIQLAAGSARNGASRRAEAIGGRPPTLTVVRPCCGPAA